MSSTETAQTVTIGRITYRVEHDFEDGYSQTVGHLHGPRGDWATICRTINGTLVAHGSRTLDRVSNRTVHHALVPIFGTERQ